MKNLKNKSWQKVAILTVKMIFVVYRYKNFNLIRKKWDTKKISNMSVFSQVRARTTVDIPVWRMGSLKEATKLILMNKLLTYDDTLEGVILGIKNISPVQPFSDFYADTPAFHQTMEGDFLVFRPRKGCILPARVTFVSASSLTLTILGYFTGNVELNELKHDWTFTKNMWRKGADAFGEGDEVSVEITRATPSINGMDLNVKVLSKLANTENPENPEE